MCNVNENEADAGGFPQHSDPGKNYQIYRCVHVYGYKFNPLQFCLRVKVHIGALQLYIFPTGEPKTGFEFKRQKPSKTNRNPKKKVKRYHY